MDIVILKFLTHHCPTNELGKKRRFFGNNEFQIIFEHFKAILTNYPVLHAPDYSTPFKLTADASDIRIGAVLAPKNNDICHPLSFFSKKLSSYQKIYTTVRKEALSLMLAIEHYEVYLSLTKYCIEVYTDHNPLVCINRMKTTIQDCSDGIQYYISKTIFSSAYKGSR